MTLLKSTQPKDCVPNPSTTPALLNTGVLPHSYTSLNMLSVLDFQAVTTGRTGVQQWLLLLRLPVKKGWDQAHRQCSCHSLPENSVNIQSTQPQPAQLLKFIASLTRLSWHDPEHVK